MEENTLYTRIQQKIDTETNWKNNDPVLLDGEIGFVIMEDGSVRLVVGDGSSNYNQLTTRTLYVPVVPTKVSDLSDASDYATTKDYVPNTRTVNGKPLNSDVTLTAADVGAKAADDVSANDGKLTIKVNGTNIQTFTANSAENKEANIIVPTKVSELDNDANYITEEDIPEGVKVDDALSDTSTNPVQNKVINAALNAKANSANVYTKTDANKTFVKLNDTSITTNQLTLVSGSNSETLTYSDIKMIHGVQSVVDVTF